MRYRFHLLTLLLAVTAGSFGASSTALSQETQPGAACVAGESGYFRRAADSTPADGGNFMICDGSTWVDFIHYASSGYVGIGTVNPTDILTISGDNKDVRHFSYSNTASNKADYNFYWARGTESSPLETVDGDLLGSVRWFQYSGGSFNQAVAQIAAERQGGNGGDILFLTKNGGGGQPLERIRLKNSGKVGVGVVAPATLLDIAGAIKVDYDGTACSATIQGAIRYDSGGTALNYCDGTTWQTIANGGSTGLWTDNTQYISYQSAFILKQGQTMTTAGFDGALDGGLLWYPDKYAFRAGYIIGTEWDEANTGLYSVALGRQATAKGSASLALGNGAFADGIDAIAMGQGADAGGTASIALGKSTNAAGNQSVAIGSSAQATMQPSYAFGASVVASGVNAMALGRKATASGTYSAVLGLGDSVLPYPVVSGQSSFGIFMGDQTGVDLTSSNYMGIYGGDVLIYNSANEGLHFWTSNPFSYIDADNSSLMFRTTSNNDIIFRPNTTEAMRIKAAGNVGIGTSAPAGRLHISGTAYSDIILEDSVGGGALGALQFNENGNFRAEIKGRNDATTGYSLQFVTDNTAGERMRITGTGKVGIGTTDPATLLDVVGAVKVDYDATACTAAIQGAIRYDSGGTALNYCNGTAWQTIASGGTTGIWTIGAGDNIYYNSGTPQVGIGTATPAYTLDVNGDGAMDKLHLYGAAGNTPVSSVPSVLDDLTDVTISGPSAGEILLYSGGAWVNGTTTSGGLFELSTGDVRYTGDYTNDNFVWGATRTYDLAGTGDDKRFFFYKSLGAFRAGQATGLQWNFSELGGASIAMGYNTMAQGTGSVALGYGPVASGDGSVAVGRYSSAGGNASFAAGQDVLALGDNSFAFGLGDATGASPQVSGANSFGIFMGDQSGIDLVSANTMAVMGGNVGVGTTTPSALLHTSGGDFVVTGTTTGTASVPVTGSGSRMLFDVETGAFRAGEAWGTGWDDSNVGLQSFATGAGTSASGNYSTAMGYATTASGAASVAIATSATASGNYSLVTGRSTTAASWYGMAMGYETTVTAAGTNSAALGLGNASGAFPQVSAANAFGIFMGDQSGVDLASANTMGLYGIADLVIDNDGKAGSQGCLRYNGGTSKLQYSHDCGTYSDFGSGGGGGVWEDASNVIRPANGTVDYASADFVFGSPQLADDGNVDHDSRMWFDKSKYAFRAGMEDGTNWDDANVGLASVAFGEQGSATGDFSFSGGKWADATANYAFAYGSNSDASGGYSVALGQASQASGDHSFAAGWASTASGNVSFAFGRSSTTASGNYSIAMGSDQQATAGSAVAIGTQSRAEANSSVVLGQEARVTSAGVNSFAFGLGNATGTIPQVSGDSSFGIFMGDQSGYDLSSSNVMALVGGEFRIDYSSAGSMGCIKYNEGTSKLQYSHDCGTYSDLGSATVTPAGNHFEIQFNSNGTLWSSPDLHFNDTWGGGGALGIGVSWPTAELHIHNSNGGSTPKIKITASTGYTSQLGRLSGNDFQIDSQDKIYLIDPTGINGGWSDPANSLDVGGAVSIGGGYYGTAAPANGLIVQGNTGIGTTNPAAILNISGGEMMFSQSASDGCIRYNSGTSKMQYSHDCGSYSDFGGTGLWADNTTHISYQSAHLVKSGQTLPAALTGAGTRMLWYPNKHAFRAGYVSSTQWDEVNINNYSMALGVDVKASGYASVALGRANTASSAQSTALGFGNTAGAAESLATGHQTYVTGQTSVAFGKEVNVSGAMSMGIGLGDATANTAGDPTNPTVSGDYSLGIFMGNQSGVNLSSSNVMAIMGGKVGINTVSPSYDLHVYESNGGSIAAMFENAGDVAIAFNHGSAQAALQYDNGTNGLEFRVGSTGASDTEMFIGDNGNVGIGTTTPGNALDVVGTTQTDYLQLDGVAAGAPTSYIPSALDDLSDVTISSATSGECLTYNGSAWVDGACGGGSSLWSVGSGDDIYYNSGAARVGIGTTSPTRKLEIVSSNQNGIRVVDAGANDVALELENSSGHYEFGIKGTTGDLGVYDYASSTRRMVIQKSTGNIGIGTTSPDGILTIAGSNQDVHHYSYANGATQKADYEFYRAHGTEASPAIVADGDEVGTIRFLPYRGDSFNTRAQIKAIINGTVVNGGATPTDIAFLTGTNNLQERMRIMSNGDIGVGTSAPIQQFTLGGLNTDLGIESIGGTDSQKGDIYFYRAMGTEAARTALTAADFQIGTLTWIGHDGTNYEDAAQIKVITGATPGNNDMPGTMVFSTTPDGSNTLVERMRIEDNGYVGIGSNSPAAELYVSGSIQFTGTITDVSDRRLKKDISLLSEGQIAKIMGLEPVSFRMKDNPNGPLEYGFIAQDVEKIYPALVNTADDEIGTKSLNYMGMIAPMTLAMQELKTENDALKAELAQMKAQQDDIMKEVKGLKAHTGYGINKAGSGAVFMAALLAALATAGLFTAAGYVHFRRRKE